MSSTRWETGLFRAWSQPASVRLTPTRLVLHQPSCPAWIAKCVPGRCGGYGRLCAHGEGGTLGCEWGRPPLRRAKGWRRGAGQKLTHQAQLWGRLLLSGHCVADTGLKASLYLFPSWVLNTTVFILAQLLRPKAQNQDVSWAMPLPKATGRTLPRLAQPRVAPRIPWLVAARLPPLPPLSIALSLWVSVFCLSAQISHKDTSQGPPLIQYDPILTALVCQDFIPFTHVPFLVNMNFGGYASQPSTIPSPSSVRVYRVLFPSFYRWRWRRDQSHTPEEEGSTIGHPSLGRDGAAYQLGPGLQPPGLCSFLPAPLQPLPAAGRKQLSLLPC